MIILLGMLAYQNCAFQIGQLKLNLRMLQQFKIGEGKNNLPCQLWLKFGSVRKGPCLFLSLPSCQVLRKTCTCIPSIFFCVVLGALVAGWLVFLKGITSFCAFTYGYNIVLYILIFLQVHFLFRAYLVSLNRIF